MAGTNTETCCEEILSQEAELCPWKAEPLSPEGNAPQDPAAAAIPVSAGSGKKSKKSIFRLRRKEKQEDVLESPALLTEPGKKRFSLGSGKKKKPQEDPAALASTEMEAEDAGGMPGIGYGDAAVPELTPDSSEGADEADNLVGETPRKKGFLGIGGSGKKSRKSKKAKKEKKVKEPSGKKGSGLGLRKKKVPVQEASGETVGSDDVSGNEDELIPGILKRIEKLINPKPEVIDELVFEPGVVCKPMPGVAHKDVDIIYEVTPRFQYVHVSFDGEELSYECMEPPLSEAEKQTMEIVQNAFDKMAHSEILLVEEENRKDALRDRFQFITEIYRFKLTDSQKDKFFYYLHKKYMGFDKIDLLMKDPYIEDVTCNGPYSNLYVNHRIYGSLKTNVSFEELELNNFVMRMAQAAGRHISVLQPIRDATLTDGSRANLTLGKEVTKRGSTFTIRRFKSNPVSCIDLMNYGTYDARVLAYFWLMIEYKRSVLAAGGTASGKTTTLNALGSFIPPEYKIVSIEDTAEMNLMHPNWTQSITRAGFGGDSSGKSAGDIELFDLLKAALRQRPEYIVVGEVRGAEAGTLFQAISVGHPCMGTIHAGSIHELLSRVESEPMNVPRNLFASVDMVIFNAMVKVGEHFIRRALRIVEIVELDPERKDLITNPVFKWDPVEDRYEFSGSSSLFEDIEEEFGIAPEELEREMEERASYIESLAARGICDYKDVARAIRKYARYKDELMETTH